MVAPAATATTGSPGREPQPAKGSWRRRGLAAAGGASMALATPPFDLPAGVFLSLFVFVWLIYAARRKRDAFLTGWLFGSASIVVGMRFVPTVIERFTPLSFGTSVVALVLLALAQGLAWGLSVCLGHWLLRRSQIPLELATSHALLLALSLPGVFVWSPAALLSPWPWAIQSVDILGETGLSLLITIGVAMAFRSLQAWRSGRGRLWRSWFSLAGAGALWTVLMGYGHVQMKQWKSPATARIELGLIHPAVDPKERWRPRRWKSILQRLRGQTHRAERRGAELSIWPEAAYPYPLPHKRRRMRRNRRSVLGAGVRGPVLFGYMASTKAIHRADGGWQRDKYNSATIVYPEGRLATPHDKMQLLPFGEAVPLSTTFPVLRRVFQHSGAVLPGKTLQRLDLKRSKGKPLHGLVLNCFEDTLSNYTRKAVLDKKPNLLINITNDAWFAGTHAPELHWRLAVLRSVENRLDLVRAVNHGPNGWIDAAGIVQARAFRPTPFALNVTPSLRGDKQTFYTKHGATPAIAALMMSAFAWFMRQRRNSAKRKSQEAKAPSAS